ncbi:MAG: hypothetical protein ACQJCO_00250 [cyanobacterium endosymbiont of Rhopalodia sterrenbergii]
MSLFILEILAQRNLPKKLFLWVTAEIKAKNYDKSSSLHNALYLIFRLKTVFDSTFYGY